MADDSVSQSDAFTKILDIYKSYATIPNFSWAKIIPSTESFLNIQYIISQRDLVRNLNRNALSSVTVTPGEGENKVTTTFFPLELSDVAIHAVAPSGQAWAIIRQTNSTKEKNEKQRYLEIWKLGILEKNIELTEKHGDVYADDTFGSLSWSKNESMIVYVAEKKEGNTKNKDKNEGSNKTRLDESKYSYQQDWGEKLSKKKPGCIVLIKLDTEEITMLTNFSFAVGQVIFGPSDQTLIFTGYDQEPRQYGLIACLNRWSGIYQTNLKGDNQEHISKNFHTARSPRLNLNGDRLVFLTNPLGGPHNTTARLISYDFGSKTTEIVVDTVKKPEDSSKFPGLYTDRLPRHGAWLDDDIHLFVNSVWRSQKVILSINTLTKKVQNLTPDMSSGSWIFLDNWKSYILASRSSINRPNELMLGHILRNDGSSDLAVSWTLINISIGRLPEGLKDFTWEIYNPWNSWSMEAIVVKPTTATKPFPLIISPHGGPHSVSTIDFNAPIASLATLGFSLVIVNYTGSIGFGEDAIDALLGNIGSKDVQETHDIGDSLVRSGVADGSRLCVLGGSHGGFLAAHLTGQYPDIYKACVLRNPVINTGSNLAQSDIPDWSFAETGIPYDFKRPIYATPDIYTKMFNSSPAAHVDKVKTPTLLMLGDSDRRVPNYEGLNWYYALKGRGVDASVMMYTDNGHALDGVEAETFGLCTLAAFFAKHIGLDI